MEYTFQFRESKAESSRFSLQEEGKVMAWMEFFRSGNELDTITIVHTEVDPSKKGQGLGKILLSEVLSYIKARDLKLEAQCPYVKAQLEK